MPIPADRLRTVQWQYTPVTPAQCVPGLRVHVHRSLGDSRVEPRIYEVTQPPQTIAGRHCTWLRGRTGCVALQNLSVAEGVGLGDGR